jgi:hypothetical protein
MRFLFTIILFSSASSVSVYSHPLTPKNPHALVKDFDIPYLYGPTNNDESGAADSNSYNFWIRKIFQTLELFAMDIFIMAIF